MPQIHAVHFLNEQFVDFLAHENVDLYFMLVSVDLKLSPETLKEDTHSGWDASEFTDSFLNVDFSYMSQRTLHNKTRCLFCIFSYMSTGNVTPLHKAMTQTFCFLNMFFVKGFCCCC